MRLMISRCALLTLAGLIGGRSAAFADDHSRETPAAAKTPAQSGPLGEPGFFPIGVWLQNPANAAKYREAGINLYVALWKGPTEQQLADLKRRDEEERKEKLP